VVANPTSQLLESAQQFLIESLRDTDDGRLSFAIVHAVTATELILKERLYRVNPALVYRNIDAKSLLGENTAPLSALPQRLANLGIPLGAKNANLILSVAKWRHQIVHHMPAFDSAAAERQLPKLLDFIAGYLRDDLGTPLETFLPGGMFRVAQRLLGDWQKAVAAARATAAAEGDVVADGCPRCGSTEVMCARKDNEVHCHLCGADLHRVDRCDGCGRPMYVSYLPRAYEVVWCDDCLDAAADWQAEMESDMQRGR
jgi:hypothetical protein